MKKRIGSRRKRGIEKERLRESSTMEQLCQEMAMVRRGKVQGYLIRTESYSEQSVVWQGRVE
jgi:hypothetical protein